MSFRHDKEKGVNVQVLLRCRPFSEDELRNGAPQVVTCNDLHREVHVSQTVAGKLVDRTFTFDKVFGPTAQQRDLYEQAVIPIVNEVLEGFNCTIFAYGQTGTGKTYTMEGEGKRSKNGPNSELPPDAGVIPRAVKQIFDTLESQNAEYSVKVTFLELYNEEITDLLAPDDLSKAVLDEKQKKPLALMEDGKGGVLVRGLEEEIVTSANEIFTLLERGSAKRRTAETLLNKQSSRSHSLFSITIHIKEATPEGEELIKCGKLNLVDLAGSENICRSGAREGRAREAGEINKSLLTLGRVITALVEHLGHIPYRDSKLTRLLRDSLGGRTKTCIIATVSPSVHCLDETLSTLDYAHRAKNIKNRPEVNQKMMKTTLIKDLYAEIERLKTEVYAAREKCGVYIPKERYYQEEAEKKAMADKIEQMELALETGNKRFEDLEEKYTAEHKLRKELSSNLETTQKMLETTKKAFTSLKEDYKEAQFTIKEREYVIAEQNKSENALTHQACMLSANLEKSVQDIAGLFAKIERKEKVCTGNKAVVQNFQVELTKQISQLCNIVIESMSKQKQHLHSLQGQFSSCAVFRGKVAEELNKKVNDVKALYFSHLQGLQKLVCQHKASSETNLDEMKMLASKNSSSLEEAINMAVKEAEHVLNDLQNSLSEQRCEIADFAHQTRERTQRSIELIEGTSAESIKIFKSLAGEISRLQDQIEKYHDTEEQNLIDFQRAYEEQSRREKEQLMSNISDLVEKAMGRKAEMVNTRISNLREAVVEEKDSLKQRIAKIGSETSEAKRKWEDFAAQAENNANEDAALSAAKHCRMELLLQRSVEIASTASQHWNSVKTSIADIGKNHQDELEQLIRKKMDANERHMSEVDNARASAEASVEENNQDILLHVQTSLDEEHKRANGILSVIEDQSNTLISFQNEHDERVNKIEEHTKNCLENQYMEDQPTSTTPAKRKIELPSKDFIENMRAPPMDILIEEFRENYNSDTEMTLLNQNGAATKQQCDSISFRDVRPPLSQVN